MTIDRLDFFRFLFNNGRGIKSSQIDELMLEQARKGTTGTTRTEIVVDDVEIINSDDVAYLLRVGDTTGYFTGTELHGARSGSAETVGIASFYSKTGADAGKLYQTLSEATDTALEIWRINDVQSMEAIIEKFSDRDDQVWRPFFYVLGSVGPAARAFTTCRLAPLDGGGRVSQGTYDATGNLASRLILDVARYRNDGSYYGDGTNQQEDSAADRFSVDLTPTPPDQLASDQKLFVFWAKTPSVLPTSGADSNYDVIGPVEVTGAGGYAHTASHTISELKPLIENEFDGTTGTATAEKQVAGITIENSDNVAYLIRVRASTEYALGSTLYALKAAAPLEIGIANFYSKPGDDAGKLYHTLDEATDVALEIWKVNDLSAIQSVITALGGTGGDENVQADWEETDSSSDAYIDNKPDLSGIGTDATARASAGAAAQAATAAQATADAALPKAGGVMTGKITLDGAPADDLHAATKKYVDDSISVESEEIIKPVVNVDANAYDVDDVLLSGNELWQIKETAANSFAGKLGEYTEGNFHYVATSHGDETYFGRVGSFSDNFETRIGAVLFGTNNNTVEIWVESDAYVTAKGAAHTSEDELKFDFVITDPDDPTNPIVTSITLPAGRTVTRGGYTWYVFEETAADNDTLLNMGSGWLWIMEVVVVGTTDNFFAHAAGQKHLVRFPLADTIDQPARDRITTAESDVNELQDELAKLHTYIAEHVTDISNEVEDPTQADSPAHYYLTQKARYETGGQSIPFESGLYELTTGTANKTKIKLAKVGSNFWGYVTRGFGSHADAGKMLHNPLSAIAAFFVEYDGTNYYAHAYMKKNVYLYLHNQRNLANNAVWFKMSDGTTDLVFEMGLYGETVNGGINFQHLRQHLLATSTTTATPDQFLAYFTAGNSNAPTIEIAYNANSSGFGHADYYLRYGNADTTKAYTFRESDFAVVTGYLDDVVESDSIRKIVPIGEAAYNALAVKDPNTWYIRTGA